MAAETLAGRRVVITRAADRAAGLVQRLRALGAEPIVFSTIAHAPPDDLAPFDDALQRLVAGGYDWLVLTSVTAVYALAERMRALDIGTAVLMHQEVATVGPATAASYTAQFGWIPELLPERFDAYALADAMDDVSGKRLLLANADIARDTLERRLAEHGALVERVIAYRTVPAPASEIDINSMLVDGQIDAIFFSSGSTVRFFLARLSDAALAALHAVVLICIGPSTAETLREGGYTPIVAREASEAGLVEALLARP
ncbi:uroporphyrinogen-III synthase [Candidatus Gracilibacteria bacterium]|nr:uroporphyrinogen-III synthase [Candidatus Gracilibacteria bacterium]